MPDDILEKLRFIADKLTETEKQQAKILAEFFKLFQKKEEIKHVLYEEDDVDNAEKRIAQMRDASQDDPSDDVIRDLTHLFVKYRDQLMNDPTSNSELVMDFQRVLKNISPDLHGPEILHVLDGKIDRQLLSFVSDLLKHDPRMPHGGYSLPDYEMPLELGREQGVMPYNRGQTDAFMRAPQHNGPYDDEAQIDDRKGHKNLVHEIVSLNEQDASGNSGIYGIVLEPLKELSQEEKSEFSFLSGLWLDPNSAKYTRRYLKSWNYDGLMTAVKQLFAAFQRDRIRYDPNKFQNLEKRLAGQSNYDKNLLEDLVYSEGPLGELLKKRKIEVERPINQGKDGIVFEIKGGKILKVTTNKEEGEAANKILKTGNQKHIVGVFDVFYFTKDQVQQIKNPIKEQTTATQSIRGAERQSARSTPQQTPTPKQEPQKTSTPSDQQIVQSTGQLQTIAEKFDIRGMLEDLKKVGLYYPDFHSENIMKRGDGTYVITDLGRSKPGIPVNTPLAEKKNFLKQLILEVLKNKN